jgi:hypothetical protein
LPQRNPLYIWSCPSERGVLSDEKEQELLHAALEKEKQNIESLSDLATGANLSQPNHHRPLPLLK